MLPLLEATPCPTSASSYDYLNILPDRLADNLGYEDNTSNIEYTKQFQVSLRATGPKRRATTTRSRRPGKSMNFAIHDDEGPEILQHDLGYAKQNSSQTDKLSVLAQPAQRPRPVVSFGLGNTHNAPNQDTTLTRKSHQNGSAPCMDLAARSAHGKSMARRRTSIDEIIKKPARRGTVYIPPEDTTMPTVWMGVFSPIKDLGALDKDSLGDGAAGLTGIAAQMAKKRALKKSTVTAAPRRAPLQQALKPSQEKTIHEDIPGRLTGKENLPPGHHPTGKGKVKESPVGSSQQSYRVYTQSTGRLGKRARPSCRGTAIASSKGSSAALLDATSGICRPEVQVAESISDRDVKNNFARLRLSEGKMDDRQSRRSNEVLKAQPQPSTQVKFEKVPAKILVPSIIQPVLDQDYPLLSEDIQNPSLYENNWLAHQEIAITQLLNNLFDAASGSTDTNDVQTTRQQLLLVYQDQSMVLLQKRLQASLLYGSLNVPKGTSAKSKLAEDLGMKQNFLNLWLDTYNQQILQACAEVVIGRECSSSPRTSSTVRTSTSPPSKIVSKKNLSRFLETFLIRNEDMAPDLSTPQPGTTGLQHTLLRSLMLIILLDKSKSLPQTPFPDCLFQPSSPHKSSVAVIHALAQMLLPSAGNILRSLSHIHYIVTHVQYPLEEYAYQISNLAVDLRDGVRLTRLVELLLYPSASNLLSPADTTTTVTMPTGKVLSLLQGEHDWPLSQHLKFPCLGRATKLYNVQIALSALSGITGISKMVEDIKAEHIVDGFREKTVALLWWLAGKWGLGSLIDWVDLKGEIWRLGGSILGDGVDDEDEEAYEDDFAKHKFLLKEWASAAAASRGLTVNNLTTSFADGRVFEALVELYEVFLPGGGATANKIGSGSSPQRHLSQRLSDLGCSVQFASLFAPTTNTSSSAKFFDPNFTLASLSFLASRLLSASKRARAATRIQKTWRGRLRRREMRRKVVLKRLAQECKVVVEMRERLG